jgi:GUN4-like/NACHT domain
MPETPDKKEEKTEKKDEKAPWNELLGKLLIKVAPVIVAGGVSGALPLIKGDEFSKIAFYTGIGGVGGGIATIVSAIAGPSWERFQKGSKKFGDVAAYRLELFTQTGIAKATGAEVKYLEAQKLACQTDRCQGLMRNSVPLLEEIYVPLSISGGIISAGWQKDATMMELERSNHHQSIWQILRQVEKTDAGQMAILAWGGYGKTTLLKHITYIYSSEQYDRDEIEVSARIPVFLALGECWKKYWAGKEVLPGLATTIMDYHVPSLPSDQTLRMESNWAEERLKAGKVIVLLDGLDEVPKEHRSTVAKWIDQQVGKYRRSIFIVTSRPKAYQEQAKANRLSLRNTLYVEALDVDRRRQFVQKWFFHQESFANSGRETADVKQVAQQSAEKLLAQIESRHEMQDLAKIPLLLNMIATFYHSTGKPQLPNRRVDLYQKICDLQLKDRPEAKELTTQLVNKDDQSLQAILQKLALEMLLNNREKTIDYRTLLERFQTYLQAENETVDARAFLEDVVRISELLIEKDADGYEFAHWSFQEYLAAREILEQDRADIFTDKFMDLEWKPTIVLYVAQLKEPSKFIREILAAGAKDLAYDCLQETTRQVKPELAMEIASLRETVQASRYAELEKLLRAGQWEEADRETYRLMITAVGKEEGQIFDRTDLENFPCEDLLEIDRLWIETSNEHFGFSVQKKVWQRYGSPMVYNDDYRKFMEEVGWRSKGSFVRYEDLQFSLFPSPAGELPTLSGVVGLVLVREGEGTSKENVPTALLELGHLFSRAETCKL